MSKSSREHPRFGKYFAQSPDYKAQPQSIEKEYVEYVDWKGFELRVGEVFKPGGVVWEEEDYSKAIEKLSGRKPCQEQLREMLCLISKRGRASHFPRGYNIETGMGIEGELQKLEPDRFEIKFEKEENKFKLTCEVGRSYLRSIIKPYLVGEKTMIRKFSFHREDGPPFKKEEWPIVRKFSSCSYLPPHPQHPASVRERFSLDQSIQGYFSEDSPVD